MQICPFGLEVPFGHCGNKCDFPMVVSWILEMD